jgi:hypothetical protein
MKTVIFWILKILEIACVYLWLRLGHIVYVLDFGRYAKPFWSVEGGLLSLLFTFLIIAVPFLAFILLFIAIKIAVPKWIDLNKKWAKKIAKRIKQ